jgi:hypothetical protein
MNVYKGLKQALITDLLLKFKDIIYKVINIYNSTGIFDVY